MTFYVFQLLFIAIFSFIATYTKDRFFYFVTKTICFLILFIPAAVRYGIGTDYVNYVSLFNRINGHGITSAEIGWQSLNLFLGKHGFSYVSVFVISSFLCYIFLIFTKKEDFFIVIITYYCYLYSFSYNGVRNAITISMAWYAYLCLSERKRIKAYLILFISSFFHLTAIIYILFFIVMDIVKISRKMTFILTLFITCIMSVIDLQNLILSLPLPDDFKYIGYLSSKKYFASTTKSTGLGILLRRICIIVSYLMATQFQSEKEKNYTNWFFMALWVADLLAMDTYIFYRIQTLFYLSHLQIMSSVNFRTKNGYLIIGNVFLISYMVFIAFIRSTIHGVNEIVPYQTIWGAR